MKSWQALRGGAPLYGSFLSTNSTISTEVMGTAGFDFLIIDLEHGTSSERDVLYQLQALEHTPALGVVRVESHERQRVHRILDLGAHGIMFPRVDNASQARACIAAMRYPPEGTRGVATLVRASQYGANFAAYQQASATALLTILQIETAEAVENVEAIAALDGAEVLFIGPMDLSTSLGVFREYGHPKFVQALRRTVAAARTNNRVAAILLPSAAEGRHYREMGFRMMTCGTDISFLQAGARQTAELLRSS